MPRKLTLSLSVIGTAALAAVLVTLNARGQGGVPVVRTSPEAGLPRPWEAGLQVSPFSTVNLFNGNLTTVIPLVSYDPVGPAVSFTLYHNSAAAGGTASDSPTGFSFGPGWSCTYSGSVFGDPGDEEVTLTEDDGNQYTFDYASSDDGDYFYDPPAGIHDLLMWDHTNGVWVLTRRDQSKRVFDCEQRPNDPDLAWLVEEHDSSGNYVLIQRDAQHNNRIDYVASAAETNDLENVEHKLEFDYTDTELTSITDPIGRTWEFDYFEYDPVNHPGDYTLQNVNYPTDATVDATYVEFGYSTNARITWIVPRDVPSDDEHRDVRRWDYTYSGIQDRFDTVTDPPAVGVSPRNTQDFLFHESREGGFWITEYKDRRANALNWSFYFDAPGNFRKQTDPQLNSRQWVYDSDHNVTGFFDELNHTWTATYGPVGNVLTVTSPIANQTWTVAWAQPYPTERPNFWRPTQVTDPLSHWVKYQYEQNDETDPTLVTTFVEQAVAYPLTSPDALTIIDYGDLPNDSGSVTGVTDPNGVTHTFDHDGYGYPSGGSSGLAGCEPPDCYTNTTDQGNDAVGQANFWCVERGGNGDCDCWSSRGYDVNGNTTSTECITCLCAGTTSRPVRLGNVPSPVWGYLTRCLNSAEYDDMGRPRSLDLGEERWDGGGASGTRQYELSYDQLGRPTTFTMRSDEHSGNQEAWIEREFEYLEYDEDGRVLQREGPDSQVTEFWSDYGQQERGYDPLGRPKTITRGGMSVTYTYDAASRVTQVDYGNGAYIERQYDNANRLTTIKHYGPGPTLLYQIDYVWNLDNTLYSRVETDNVADPATVTTVTFHYDNRRRLTRETRVLSGDPDVDIYDITYSYDQGGNRKEKSDSVSELTVKYTYDVDLDPYEESEWPGYPDVYPTHNNRLLYYKVYDDQEQTLRTVSYVYYDTGHVSNIIVKDEYTGQGTEADYDWYRGLMFTYYGVGPSEAGLVLTERWKDDGQGGFSDHEPLALRELRYHGDARARFIVRDLDPSDDDREWSVEGAETWTDYDTVMPYTDFEVTLDEENDPVATDQTRYLNGFGTHAQYDIQGEDSEYLHGDLIRSTNLTTDGSGDPVSSVAYSAFGELVTGYSALDTRYQYAGGWGYESDLLVLEGAPGTAPITLQHLGYRWYQPDTGRFIQRDPIGILGGINGYVYVLGDPLSTADPSGLSPTGEERQIERILKAIEKLMTEIYKGHQRYPGIRRIVWPLRGPLQLLRNRLRGLLNKLRGGGGPAAIILIPVCVAQALEPYQPAFDGLLDEMAGGLMVGRMGPGSGGAFSPGEIRDYIYY